MKRVAMMSFSVKGDLKNQTKKRGNQGSICTVIEIMDYRGHVRSWKQEI